MNERDRSDACPGILAPHQAADGPLARIRVPGGRLGAEALRGLATAAALGDGALELTSRGNVQVRAVRELGAFEAEVAAAGLLPSTTHERVRNILGSPFDGRLDGAVLTDVITALDAQLCSRAVLSELPGRFLFAVDDGTGDVAHAGADVSVLAETGGPTSQARWRLLLAGTPTDLRTGDPVAAALEAAEAFQRLRGPAWRLAELAGGPERVAAALGTALLPHAQADAARSAATPPVGTFRQRDGRYALGLLARLGRVTAAQADTLAGLGALRLTPWRGAVLLDLDEPAAAAEAAEAAGLVTDPRSPWSGVTACAGKPNCAKALRDVRADAANALGAPGLPVHWVGCAHRCGRPRGAVLVEADEHGYLVDGKRTEDVVRTVEAARRG